MIVRKFSRSSRYSYTNIRDSASARASRSSAPVTDGSCRAGTTGSAEYALGGPNSRNTSALVDVPTWMLAIRPASIGRPKRCALIAQPKSPTTPISSATPLTQPTFRTLLREALEQPAPTRVAQLAQRLGLDLPDPLARDLEILAHLFERVIRALADPEPQLEHLLLARRERR